MAVGDDFIEEAIYSATQAKSVMPEISISLISDMNVSADCFDHLIQISEARGDGGDRIYHARKSPYDRTLFVDTDIYIAEPVDEIFSLLDEFEVAACINQRDYSSNRIDIDEINSIPDCFPEYNGGVLAFRKGETVDRFFKAWEQMFERVLKRGQVHNQAALRWALYNSDVRVATMRNEYNCVYRRPGAVNGPVKIFHGRLLNIESYGAEKVVDVNQAINELNRSNELRIYHRIYDKIELVEPSLIKRGLYSLRYQGVFETIKDIINR